VTVPSQRWRQLALLATAELLGMSVWFAGAAAAPALRARLHLSGPESAWITSSVQLGFVIGTLVVAALNLSDILPLRWYVAGSALLAAVSTAVLLPARSFPAVIVARAVTGIALAGVYPPAMKMAATWFRAERGLAIGAIVGALTVGKATPYLLEGVALPLRAVILVPAGAALIAAGLIVAWYHDGPFAFPVRPFSWPLALVVFRDRDLRRVTGGYLGHMWELYAFWASITAYLTASFSRRDPGAHAGAWPFACIAIGALGCVWGGRAADRIGRAVVVRRALVVSGACCVASAVVFGGPRPLVLALCLVWGVAVIADSAQFSALMTECAPPHAVGTALTLQTSLGFLLTIGSIQLVPHIASRVGWRWAMIVLVLGPATGLWSVKQITARTRAERLPETRHDG
jgi:MFS family permease